MVGPPLQRVYRVSGLCCVFVGSYLVLGIAPRGLIWLVASFAPLVSAVLWLQGDALARGASATPDWGLFALLAWPVLIPWYAFKTRGVHGWPVAVFLFIPILAPFAVASAPLLRRAIDVAPYDVPATTDVFSVAQGTWGWRRGECDTNPHTISFSPDRRYMLLAFAKPVKAATGVTQDTFRYEVRRSTRSSIRGFLLGETRRTDRGDLVVWDLVLSSRDTYRWHRTDWADGLYTSEVARCEAAP